jgi:hypothetical protein
MHVSKIASWRLAYLFVMAWHSRNLADLFFLVYVGCADRLNQVYSTGKASEIDAGSHELS